MSPVRSSGSNVHLLHILFGTVLALGDPALILLGVIATATLAWLANFYRPLALECVEAPFLRTVSPISALTHLSFLGMVVLNLVAAFQALGTLLSMGLTLLPAISDRYWARDISGLIPVSIAIGFASSTIGLLASFYHSWPSGPSIILAAGGLYVLSMLFGPCGGLVRQLLPARHLEA